MENQVTIKNDQLIIEPKRLDKLWAVKSKLSIPLDHIGSVKYFV